LVENPEGKRPLRGPRHRWEDTTGMNLGQMWLRTEINGRGLLITVMNLRIPQNIENLLCGWATVSFARAQLHIQLISYSQTLAKKTSKTTLQTSFVELLSAREINDVCWDLTYARMRWNIKITGTISRVNVELNTNVSDIASGSIIRVDVANDRISLIFIPVCPTDYSSYWCTMHWVGGVKLGRHPSTSNLSPCCLTWSLCCQTVLCSLFPVPLCLLAIFVMCVGVP
jgi:hypothetical protein